MDDFVSAVEYVEEPFVHGWTSDCSEWRKLIGFARYASRGDDLPYTVSSDPLEALKIAAWSKVAGQGLTQKEAKDHFFALLEIFRPAWREEMRQRKASVSPLASSSSDKGRRRTSVCSMKEVSAGNVLSPSLCRHEGTILKESTTAMMGSSWSSKFLVLEGFMLKCYNDEFEIVPSKTVALHCAVINGIFTPESNASLSGAEVWSFTLRWPEWTPSSSDRQESGLPSRSYFGQDQTWKFLHLGLANKSETQKWYSLIEEAIYRSSAPRKPLKTAAARDFRFRPPVSEGMRRLVMSNDLSVVPLRTHHTNENARKSESLLPPHLQQKIRPIRSALSKETVWCPRLTIEGAQIFCSMSDPLSWKIEMNIPSIPKEVVVWTLLHPDTMAQWKTFPSRTFDWKVSEVDSRRGGSSTLGDVIFCEYNLFSFLPALLPRVYSVFHRSGWTESDGSVWLVGTSDEMGRLHDPAVSLNELSSSSTLRCTSYDVVTSRETPGIWPVLFRVFHRMLDLCPGNGGRAHLSSLQRTDFDFVCWKIGPMCTETNTLPVTCVLRLHPSVSSLPNVSEFLCSPLSSALQFFTIRPLVLPAAFLLHLLHLRTFLLYSRPSEFTDVNAFEFESPNAATRSHLEVEQSFMADFAKLSSSQQMKVNSLLRKVLKCGTSSSDVTRFLISCQWEPSMAESRLKNYLCWRRDYRVDCLDTIYTAAIQQEVDKSWGYLCPDTTDWKGRPIIIIEVARLVHSAATLQDVQAMALFLIEHSIKKSKADAEQFCVVANAEKVRWARPNFFDPDLQALWLLLLNFYPERLGLIVTVQPSLPFKIMMAAARSLFPPKTVRKLRLLPPPETEERKRFLEAHFPDPRCLPVWCS